MVVIRTVILAGLMATGACATNADEPMTVDEVVERARAGIDFIDNAHILARQAANPDLLLIDVRSAEEFAAGRIPGSTSMPRGSVEFSVATDVRDADREIIVYCRSGSRASLVTKALRSQGYTNVEPHEGFRAWADNGGIIENDAGRWLAAPEKEDGDQAATTEAS